MNELSKEMDADNPDTEFGKMMIELNQTMDNVFSGISMQAKAVLTDADSSIKRSLISQCRVILKHL